MSSSLNHSISINSSSNRDIMFRVLKIEIKICEIVNVPKHGIPPAGKIKKLKSMGNEYYQKLRILIRKLDKYK